MNAMKWNAIFVLCLGSTITFAQNKNKIFPPIASEKEVVHNLFNLNDDGIKNHFTINIPGGDFLLVEFNTLSDWRDTGAFHNVMAATSIVLDKYKESLRNQLSGKSIYIHIPISGQPITSKFTQSFDNSNLISIEGTDASPLKIGMDTIRILKNIGTKKTDDGVQTVQIQYTFLLRDINRFKEVASNNEWKLQTATILDSVVLAYRKKWSSQDAWYHRLYVNYDPTAKDQKLIVNQKVREDDKVFPEYDMLTVSTGFGASLIRNTLCPSVDFGLGYYFYSDKQILTFTRLSLYTFARFEERADKSFETFATSFVNLEIGSESNNKNSKLPFYSTSIGFGYKLVTKEQINRDPSMSYNMYRLFFNYGLTKSIMITPEFVTNFKTKEKSNGWFGLSIKVGLF
jgi:hypothetical protein